MPQWLRLGLTLLAALVGGWAGLFVIGGGAAGVGWIFPFGDDPWPTWGEELIVIIAGAGMIGGAVMLGLAAWRATGKTGS
ncbi:MAG: hypothetical protein ACR2FK_03380 [Sphingomicrobium sp.]